MMNIFEFSRPTKQTKLYAFFSNEDTTSTIATTITTTYSIKEERIEESSYFPLKEIVNRNIYL